MPGCGRGGAGGVCGGPGGHRRGTGHAGGHSESVGSSRGAWPVSSARRCGIYRLARTQALYLASPKGVTLAQPLGSRGDEQACRFSQALCDSAVNRHAPPPTPDDCAPPLHLRVPIHGKMMAKTVAVRNDVSQSTVLAPSTMRFQSKVTTAETTRVTENTVTTRTSNLLMVISQPP